MCQSEILSDPGSFRRARAAIRMVAGRMPLLTARGRVTYTGTSQSVPKLTSVEQKPNLTTVIFKVFAQGRTSDLDRGKGGRLEPAVVSMCGTFGPFASVGLFALGFQFPTAEREDGSNQKTRQRWLSPWRRGSY